MPDAVDIRRFSDRDTLMIDARLHPADVIAHDEEDIRLLRRSRVVAHWPGRTAHTDTNAVAPRSTARDAEPKLARLGFQP